MNVDLFISRRLSASDRHGRTSPAVKVAIASVALSIAIMILSVSIVGGFRREIIQKVTGFNAHLTLYSGDESTGVLYDSPALDSIISGTRGVASHSLSLSVPVVLKTTKAFRGLYLRSMPQKADTAFLHSVLTEGKLPAPKSNDLLISSIMSRHLGLHPGDSINMFLVSGDISARRIKVSGIFNSHFETYDDYFAYTPLPAVQAITMLNASEGSSIDISLTDLEADIDVATLLMDRLNQGIMTGELTQTYRLDSARNRGSNFFAWLDMLDTNVWIILSLMTLVAAFTLISGILIIILEKVRFIGVMRAIGASASRLRRIFRLLAIRIALIGIITGNAVAITFIIIQHQWHVIPLNPEAYYIDFVPVSFSLPILASVNIAFILIIYLMLVVPAQLVSRISPAESMRFEH